jgi:hypothetical protein
MFRPGPVGQGPVRTMSASASCNRYGMRPRRVRWTLSGLRLAGWGRRTLAFCPGWVWGGARPSLPRFAQPLPGFLPLNQAQ